MPRVLVVGSEAESLRALEDVLRRSGYESQTLIFAEGVTERPKGPPDAVVIDLTTGLPVEVIGQVLDDTGLAGHVATLVALRLEQLAELEIRLRLDDFFVWPGRSEEIQARLRCALWRRSGLDPTHILRVSDDLLIDTASYTVYLGGRPLDLRYKEYELLRFLAMNPDKVLTRAVLLNAVWGYDYLGGIRTVDVHVRRLRSKIEGRTRVFIETVRNVGYRFHAG